MSLAITFPTTHGIIMSADRRIMTTITHDLNIKETFLLTDNDRKLFLLPNGFGISYTGSSSINGKPLSFVLSSYIKTLSSTPSDPNDLIIKIATYIRDFNAESNICILIMAGYHQNAPFVFSINTDSLDIQKHPCNKSTLVFSGETDILISLLNSEKYTYDYEKFSLQDAVSFLAFLNKIVALLQHYQQRSQTVSEDCDVLAILPDGAQWVNNSQLVKPMLPIVGRDHQLF